MVEIYPLTSGYKPSADYKVAADGRPVFVGGFAAGAHASLGSDGPVSLTVWPAKPIAQVPVVNPWGDGMQIELRPDGALQVQVAGPGQYVLQPAGAPQLMLFINPLESNKPDPDDPLVRFFRAGKVHDAGDMELKWGETIYIEGGAVVKGRIRSHQTQHVTVAGCGILDGRHYPRHALELLVFDGCGDIRLENFVTLGTPGDNLVLGGCSGVAATNLKLVGWVAGANGLVVNGSSRVAVRDSYVHSCQDCLSVRASDQRTTDEPTGVGYRLAPVQTDWRQNVDGVDFSNCVLHCERGGNAMRVGPVLDCASVRHIRFDGIKVLPAASARSVFALHNGGSALVEKVRWENCIVEAPPDLLLDLRLLHGAKGSVREVGLAGIQCWGVSPLTVLLIMGQPEAPIEQVGLEEISFDGKILRDGNALPVVSAYFTPSNNSPRA